MPYNPVGVDQFNRLPAAVVTAKADEVLKASTAAAIRSAIGAASPADVAAMRDSIVGSAPGQLDTLDEIAAALGDDGNYAAAVTAALAQKLTPPTGGSAGQVLAKSASGYEWITPAAGGGGGSAAVGSTPQLAFDMPVATNNKKVLAHYFPPYPISLDNADPASDYYETGYIAPGGEGGAHAAYGGLLRNRPLPRPVRTEADYQTANLREEVRQAISAGVDGFLVDILVSRTATSNPIHDIPGRLLNAAAAVSSSFKVVLMPDVTAGFSSMSATAMRDELLPYATHPAVGRLPDGRLVVAPFYAEGRTPQFWSDFKAAMLAAGHETVLMLCFLDAGQSNQSAYASVAYGFGNWGNRNPLGNDPASTSTGTPRDLMAKAQAAGKLWMQPVSLQDCRMREGVYDESENSTNFRRTWEIANSGADWVQLVTWNDYVESSAIGPSRRTGWAPLDLGQYWLAKFRTGAVPPIVRDVVYLSHRTQPFAASPTYNQSQLMTLRAGTSPARNLIEVVAFLTAAANVTVDVAGAVTTFSGVTGVNVFTLALAPGVISASIVRAGVTVQTTTTPLPATNSPYVQTLDYVYSSSRR